MRRPAGLAPPSARTAATSRPGSEPGWPWPGWSLADRPWVLIDEPTAHLDDLTEQVIADTIVELGRTRAVVLVAHDPVMVRLADHRLHLEAPAAACRSPSRAAADGASVRTQHVAPVDVDADEAQPAPADVLGQHPARRPWPRRRASR